MPKAFAEKAMFNGDIEAFLRERNGTGAKVHEILEHMRIGWAHVQSNQITHALHNLLQAKRVTRWKGSGRGDTWVSVAGQDKANAKIVEQPSEVKVEPLPGLKVTLYQSSGNLRIEYGKLNLLVSVEE